MRTLPLVALTAALLTLPAQARPFRAMVTRTAETTNPANVELGLRYQGFFLGRGSGLVAALPYHQISPGLRFGLLPGLEANVGIDFLLLDVPGSSRFRAYVGDVPLGLQFTFVDTSLLGLGLYGRATLPVGPSSVDLIPPPLSDGTLDAEGTFIAEIRATRSFRIMINLGYLFHGTRPNASIRDFDVPDALRYDVAATLNLGDRVLLGVEFVGRSYLRDDITPVWNENPHQWEVIPHARLETIPNLVLEAALGIAVSPHLQEIYTVRGLLGFTYEFDLGGDGPDRDDRRGRGRGKGRGRGR